MKLMDLSQERRVKICDNVCSDIIKRRYKIINEVETNLSFNYVDIKYNKGIYTIEVSVYDNKIIPQTLKGRVIVKSKQFLTHKESIEEYGEVYNTTLQLIYNLVHNLIEVENKDGGVD